VDVVVLGGRPQPEQRLVGDLAGAGRVGAVPANVRDALVGVVELAQRRRDDAEALDRRILLRALEQRLETNAYPHERLSGADVFADGLDIASLLELLHAVTKVADTRNDEFLGRYLYQRMSIGVLQSCEGRHTSAAGTSAGDLTHWIV
jgi:hypothetical protein